MTTIRVDPTRPPVDTDTLRCPACRQTLSAIIGAGADLPVFHRRWATGGGVRIDAKNRGNHQSVCAYDGDDLARLVFIAQTDLEAHP